MAKSNAKNIEHLKPSEIAARSESAWTVRNEWRPILEEVYELVAAARNPYANSSKRPKPMDKQFDSTAPNSAIKLTNRILNDITPPDKNWVDCAIGPLMGMKYSKDQLEQVKPLLYNISQMANMIVNSGGAVQARWEAFYDLVLAGLGAMLTMDDPDNDLEPIMTQAVSQSEIAIEEDGKGNISGIYRPRKKVKVRNLKNIWPDIDLTDELEKEMRGKERKNDPEVDLLEATYFVGKGSDGKWCYDILWSQATGKDPVRLVERQYTICPWTIWRWMKLPGQPYGPGPVILALPDIRTANKVVEMILFNAAIAMAGIFLIKDDGVINPDNVLIEPGALIPVGSTGGNMGASMVPLQTGRSFEVGNIVLQNLQESIKKYLFDTSLPPLGAGARSATEMVERIAEANRDIGGGIGRMSADTIQWVRRILEIASNRGLIPKLPFDQLNFKVQINAPLARAQKMADVQNVLQWFQMAQAVGGPQITQLVIKAEALIVWMAEQMAIPSELVRTEAEQQKLSQEVAGAMALSQQAAGGVSQPAANMTA